MNINRKKNNYRLQYIRIQLVLAFMIFSNSLYATGLLEEVVVQARKRDQSLQEVGLTVNTYSEKSISDRGLNDPYQLAATVPNLQAFDQAAGQSHFRIRGIGLNEFNTSFDSPVAVNINEIILSKPFMGSLGQFDIQRIEVLKGPQGTLFGRNSTGGAVNYYTNRPTDENSGQLSFEYDKWNHAKFEGALSGPLGENLLGRIAFQGAYADKDTGEYKNLYNDRRIGGRDNKKQVRISLDWSNDSTSIATTSHFGKHKGELTPYDNLFQDIPGGAQAGGTTDINKVITDPYGRFTVNQDHYPTRDNENWGLNFRVDHEFALGTITSLTGFEYFERDQREDSDNTPIPTININWYSEIEQFSQEIRLLVEEGGWASLVGLYYERDDLDASDNIDLGDARLGDQFNQVTDSYAIFTNQDFSITEQFELSVGLRYTKENNAMKGASYLATGVGEGKANIVDPSTFIFPPTVISDVDRTDDDINYNVGLTFIPHDDLTFYTSYGTGFRSGGYDIGFGTTLEVFDPEDVSAFELGFKSKWLSNTLSINAAIFSTRVENYQGNAGLPTDIVPRRRNVGELETVGAEFELHWLPLERWEIQIAGGYTEAEIVESDFEIDGVSIEGNIPANSPEFSFSALSDYSFPVGDNLEATIMASYSFIDERFLEIENQPDHLAESYYLLDARIALGSESDGWELSIWGRNLTDEKVLTYINDIPSFGLFLPINGARRNFGIKLDYRF